MLVLFIHRGKPPLVSIVQLCPFLNGGRKERVNLFLYNPINIRTFVTFYSNKEMRKSGTISLQAIFLLFFFHYVRTHFIQTKIACLLIYF